MKCLYCSKGIGPIRQLRDLEFCSDAHRNEFRERYRQQVFKTLAPETAPSRLADFIEQTPADSCPGPAGALQVLSKQLPSVSSPEVSADAAGVALQWPGWLYTPKLAVMPAQLAWEDLRASYAGRVSPSPTRPLSLDIQHPESCTAGAAAPKLLPAKPACVPAAAPQIDLHPAPLVAVTLPHVTRAAAPMPADAKAPRLQASLPAETIPATAGPVTAAAHAALALPLTTTLRMAAAPVQAEAPPPELQSAIPVHAGPNFAAPFRAAKPAAIALPLSATLRGPRPPAAPVMNADPRPLQAGPLYTHGDLPVALTQGTPVAFESPGTRNIAVILPTPPAAAASGWGAGALQAQPVRTELRFSAAKAPIATLQPVSLPAPLSVAETRPVSLAPLVEVPNPQPVVPAAALARRHVAPLSLPAAAPLHSVECNASMVGGLAGLGQPCTVRLAEADSTREPRVTAAIAHAPFESLAARREAIELPAALSGSLVAAPAHQDEVPAAVAPAAVSPAWDPTMAAAQDRCLIPLLDKALPAINWVPTAAGALTAPGEPLPPDVGRSVRTCAVLWTLSLGLVNLPALTVEALMVDLKDLVRSESAVIFGRDQEEARPAKSNILAIRHERTKLSIKPKFVYAAMAAAALLVGGVLLPKSSPKPVQTSFFSWWKGDSVRQWMAQRATRDFADDFRGGLQQWKGAQSKATRSWSYNTDGFIHPGQLALYSPSVPLSDYRFEFMAQVENKSVDWVVRAHDADNYYALKFTVLQGGPRPTVAMVRYPVIGGAKGERVQTPLRMMIHANTPYRVTVDVKGNKYRAYVEGQEADFWTEDRLKTGGVGFFSEAGERARVYWVKLESHGDVLGRICGLLSGKSGGAENDKENQAMNYRHVGIKEAKANSATGVETASNSAQEARISRVLSKAASLHLDGKLDEAAKDLAKAIDGGERHPALYFALGQLQYELQQYAPASASYSQAALLQPLHPTAHFNAGVCLGRVERWEDASAAFRKAISNDPARTEAHLALGACLVQLGLHSEALEAYDRFLTHHPDHDEALFGKAVALQKRDRGTEAIELYRRILGRNPNSEEALSNLISLSLANQDYEQVFKYAQRLADSQPRSQIALEGLAGAAFAAGDHKAAAGYSRKLAEVAPQVFENWFNLGVACHKAGDLSGAAEAYARATRVQADSPQAHLNLGVALQEQGDLKGARKAYERALAIDPNLPGIHWNLGLVQEQLGDAQAAEKLYAQVPENSPDSDDAMFRIGHLRLQRSDYVGSIEAFTACLEKRPNWPEARLNLGIAHWRAGDKESARVAFQELTASGGDSREALRGLAALSLEHQDYDKAFEIYRQLLDSGERSPELLYNAGLICQRRGEAEDAAVLYKEAIKADPAFGEALLNLGHALMSLGNEFEARSCWRKAVIAKPELAQRYFEPAAQAS